MDPTLSLLGSAIARLDEGWQRWQQNIEDVQIRDGLIQRFEFTYELGLKTLRRYLERTAPHWESIRQGSFDNFIRYAWGAGLLNEEIKQWRIFREQRNISSHTYNEEKAIQVCAIIPRFLAEAQYLYAALQARQSDESPD